MAGFLSEQKLMDVTPALRAYSTGAADYRAEQDYAQKQEQRNLLKQVGQTAASQGLNAAGIQAMQGGDVGTGIKLQELSLDRQAKLFDFMGRGAAAADTPEKWQAFIGTLSQTFGPASVKGFEDFRTRESAVMLALNAKDQADLKLRQQGQDLQRRQVEVAERAETKRDAGQLVEIYDENGQPQKALLKPDGSHTPIGSAKKEKPRQMSVNDITKLSDEGGKFANITGFAETFRDEFGGMGGKAWGETINTLARNDPTGVLASQVETDRAAWWQQYDRFKNVVRNDLFGSALTAPEKAAFEQADINVGMKPEIIRKNIETQRRIAETGIKRKAAALINEGYRPETIAQAYGVSVESLKDGGGQKTAAGPKTVTSKADYDKLDPGTVFIGSDGKQYRKPQ
jgi:hypothetical protein